MQVTKYPYIRAMLGFNLFLLRYKRELSYVIPLALSLDAMHNSYVVLRLYEQREKVISMS